jgi:integrase
VVEDVNRPPERDLDATHRAFTPQERVKLEQAMSGHDHEYLWLVLLLTGMRIGEATALTWDDIDFVQARLIVRKELSPCSKWRDYQRAEDEARAPDHSARRGGNRRAPIAT